MIPLPAWLTSSLFAAALTGIGGAILGGYITHRFDQIPLLEAKAQTSEVQRRYDGYRQSVTANVAKANAIHAADLERLQRASSDLQDELLKTQRERDAKSKALKDILAGAKAADVRPIGPTASEYYRRLSGS